MRLTVSEIMIFPVKSLRGIALDETFVEPRGLRFDRRWLVVDANDRFVTQRTRPRMALIAVKGQDGGLALVSPSMPPLHVPAVATGIERRVTIWRDAVLTRDVGDAAAVWLSAALEMSCRLVQMPESTERKVNPAYSMPGDIVSFADGYPFMLISQASLDDLNARLPFPLPMRRFRPNLVVEGATPFAEDTWKRVRIGNIVFRVVKPCERCIIPTVDPEAGVFAGKEPLRTLATYRNVGSKVLLGQNLIAEGMGVLHVGDSVQWLE
jgi:uncharacterized protein YcbX